MFFRGTDAYAAWQDQLQWVSSPFGPNAPPLEQYPKVPEPRGVDLPYGVPEHPIVSVVIPVFNKIDYTIACLDTISVHSPGIPFEVIVVDDGSSDETEERLAKRSDLRYLRNERNLGFVGSCNRGAQASRGVYVLFLNNDTMVLPDWLDALVDTATASEDVGLVGSKLVYPDGRLQEAGGIVWRDGSGWNYGRLEDPRSPQFNFVRDADYCSGASILVRRQAFLGLGGFDEEFAPAYYEDTSLAFALRSLGLRVIYQPRSVVVHFEGVTAGTDVTQGVKAYQARNRERFFAKWETQLTGHGLAGERPLHLMADRTPAARILIIDACTPTPDRDSGSVDMINYMEMLTRLRYRVVFIPASNLLHFGKYTVALQDKGVECIYFPYVARVQDFLEARGREFDAVMLVRADTAADHIADVREHCPQAKIIFNTVDLHFLRESRRAEVERAAGSSPHASEIKEKELGVMRMADTTIVISSAEQALLASTAPDVRVRTIPLLRRVPGRGAAGFHQRSGLVFIGGFRHLPNVDAVIWFCSAVFPELRRRLPGIELSIVGGDVPPEVAAVAGDGVQVLGFVEDIEAVFGSARLSVAPLRYGAGLKGKVATSLGYGVPCVSTSIAVEGMALGDGALTRQVAGTDVDSFVDAVLRLYSDEALWNEVSELGVRFCEDAFSLQANMPRLKELLSELGLPAN